MVAEKIREHLELSGATVMMLSWSRQRVWKRWCFPSRACASCSPKTLFTIGLLQEVPLTTLSSILAEADINHIDIRQVASFLFLRLFPALRIDPL
jgi:hypothetical protein